MALVATRDHKEKLDLQMDLDKPLKGGCDNHCKVLSASLEGGNIYYN